MRQRGIITVQVIAAAVIVIVLLAAAFAQAAQVTLAWDPNSEGDLAGYKVHYGTASGSYSVHIDVHNVTTYTVTGLSDGQTYYFAVTAYNTSGAESGYSNPVSYTVPGSPPVTPPPASVDPTPHFAGVETGTGWTYGSAVSTDLKYYDYQIVNAKGLFQVGERVQVLAQMTNVNFDHVWTIEVYDRNDVLVTTQTSGPQTVGSNTWSYANYNPYFDGLPAGYYEADVSVTVNGTKFLMPIIYFEVLDGPVITLPYAKVDFATGNPFKLENHGHTVVMSVPTTGGYNGNDSYVRISNSSTGAPYEVQLMLKNLDMTPGRLVTGVFALKGTVAGSVILALERTVSPWDNLGLYQTVVVKTAYQLVFFSFIAPDAPTSEVRLTLQIGGYVGTLSVDDVRISEFAPVSALPYTQAFSAYPHDWTLVKKSGSSATLGWSTNGGSGSSACPLAVNPVASADQSSVQLVKTGFLLAPGATVTGSIWLRGSVAGTTSNQVYVELTRTDTWANLGVWVPVTLATTGKTATFTFTAPAGVPADKVRLTVHCGKYKGTVYVDEARLQ